MAPSFSLQLAKKIYTRQEICESSFDQNLQTFEKEVLEFCRDWLKGKGSFVVHTSGSTGTPKPIQLSRHQMEASARQTITALELKPGATALLCMNPAYIGGKMMLVRAMEGNMALRLVEAGANPLDQLAAHETFDFTALVPLQLEAVLKDDYSLHLLEKAKAVIIGGAPVSQQLRSRLQKIAAPIYSTYGMTETVSHIALQRLTGPATQNYFKAFPDVQLGQDARGCLTIAGTVTANQLITTNDVVELIDSHHFRWLGRADNIINSGGIKIQLEKIEQLAEKLLLRCEQQRNLFAWSLPDERLGQKLVLIVEGPPLQERDEANWQQLFTQELVKYEQPKAIFYIPQFRQTPSGKIQKAETAALLAKPDL
jgi:O-succinylbenzoic acid--CoA ligase